MKKIISIFLLLATVATVSAQRFEWAKGYNAAREDLNEITGSVVDSLGNLYIIGHIRRYAVWGGECIVPEFYFPMRWVRVGGGGVTYERVVAQCTIYNARQPTLLCNTN